MNWKELFPKENRYFESENGILYCGDCLDTLKQIPKETIDIIITDPPYLINYKSNRRKDKTHDFCSPIANDDNYELISDFIEKSYNILKQDSAFYCFSSWKTECYFKEKIEGAGFNLKNQLIWVKNNWSAGDWKAQYAQMYELIFYANKGRRKFFTKRYPDVLHFKKVVGKQQFHQNQKPLDLIEFILNIHTQEQDLILDAFAGSGTTLVACEKLNRRWIGIELEEKYCEIAKKRILEIN